MVNSFNIVSKNELVYVKLMSHCDFLEPKWAIDDKSLIFTTFSTNMEIKSRVLT